jgi:hypothetical protein
LGSHNVYADASLTTYLGGSSIAALDTSYASPGHAFVSPTGTSVWIVINAYTTGTVEFVSAVTSPENAGSFAAWTNCTNGISMANLPCVVTVPSPGQTSIGMTNVTSGQITTIHADTDSNYSEVDIYPNSGMSSTSCAITFEGYSGECAFTPPGTAFWTMVKNLNNWSGSSSYLLWTANKVPGA